MPRGRLERARPLRDRPAYPLHEAARYVRVAPATLRSWALGRRYQTSHGQRLWQPLFTLADRANSLLSFNNLIEAHVLRALQTSHGSRIPQIRTALRYASKDLGIDRVLLSDKLSTSAGDIFIDHFRELINLSRSGQLALRKLLEAHLKRVERDASGMPVRLFPFVTDDGYAQRVIAIDPAIGFGRPIVQRKAISTRTIVDRIDAGESPDAVAADYDLGREEVDEAIVYESAAA
jgi:uncharacterized protein (DUF433 family)